MRIHFIVHEEYEGPGALIDWAEKHRFDISFSRVYLFDKLPSPNDFDLLFVMGGPQSTYTTINEVPYFDSQREKMLILDSTKNSKAVIGICLGAQLVGEAMGSPVTKSHEKEIGVFPISLTDEGKRNILFSHFPDTVNVGHWHGEMPGLTSESIIIAESEGCPRQIIEYSKFVFGFQCHLEFTKESVENLISHSEEELKNSADKKYVQSESEFLIYDFNEMNELLFGFLDKLILEYRASKNK
ncbi:Glutamine amidotransferase, class I [hydrothermal vent metagenome]|uniref:Glutamine amidotransferase, class I n=1 Tax=hydrothermal vent metagenome TaxID=652676 RepID=A0A3B1CBL9_9ZZZZ